jgi:cytochrome c peroxidase
MRLPDAAPPSRGNAYADRADAAQLGFDLFYDARFSANNDVRCATCHDPDTAFDDEKPLSKGIDILARNAPTVLDAVRQRWLFWDGRADSVWSQALQPLENPKEMGATRLGLAHGIASYYRQPYESVFGPLPQLDDASRFPAAGKPGDASWDAMTAADKSAVDRVFVNVAKAIEAYERKLVTRAAPLDRFLDGDSTAIGDDAKAGIEVFFRVGCAVCHSGALFSDGSFHNLGMVDTDADSARGRARGVGLLLASEFNAESSYYDGPKPGDFPPTSSPSDLGAFRTPTLRNVALTAPYGHTGAFPNLPSIIAFHAAGGGRGRSDLVGIIDPALVPVDLSDSDTSHLVAFLRTLTDGYPLSPWNNWPAR